MQKKTLAHYIWKFKKTLQTMRKVLKKMQAFKSCQKNAMSVILKESVYPTRYLLPVTCPVAWDAVGAPMRQHGPASSY